MFGITVSDIFYAWTRSLLFFVAGMYPGNSVGQCGHANHRYFAVLLTIQNYLNYVISVQLRIL